jgi:hypothetical protein
MSIGKFAYICFSPKSHAADILGEDHDTKTPKKRAAEKWGSPWDQSTDSVSQADTVCSTHPKPMSIFGSKYKIWRADLQNFGNEILEKSQNMTASELLLVYLLTQSARTRSLPFCSWQGSQNIKNSCTTDEDICVTELLMQSSSSSKEWHVSASTKFDKMILHYDIHQSRIHTTHTMLSTCTRIKKSQLMKNLSLWVLELCHSW